MDYLIEPISKQDLSEIMLIWARQLGWKYSEYDVDAYFKINGNHIYTLKIKERLDVDYKLIGCISISTYHKSSSLQCKGMVSSLGLFLIKEEYRKKTYGQKLLSFALEKVNNSDLISLNSVQRAAPLYFRNGFFHSKKLNNHFSVSSSSVKEKSLSYSDNFSIKSGASQVNEILEYDFNIFEETAERTKFFNIWIERKDAIVLVYKNTNKIEGYCVLTTCSDINATKTYRISPMIADSIDIAANLFKSLFNLIKETKFDDIELNALNNNPFLGTLLEDFGFSKHEDGQTELMTTSSNLLSDSNHPLFKIVAMNPLEFPNEQLQFKCV